MNSEEEVSQRIAVEFENLIVEQDPDNIAAFFDEPMPSRPAKIVLTNVDASLALSR